MSKTNLGLACPLVECVNKTQDFATFTDFFQSASSDRPILPMFGPGGPTNVVALIVSFSVLILLVFIPQLHTVIKHEYVD